MELLPPGAMALAWAKFVSSANQTPMIIKARGQALPMACGKPFSPLFFFIIQTLSFC
jgi:hypothetical protein